MEFPHLGEHCSEKTCKRLGECSVVKMTVSRLFTLPSLQLNTLFDITDFLPMRCDACQEIFCKDHITYANHKCMSSYKKVIENCFFLHL